MSWQSAYKWVAVERINNITVVRFIDKAILEEKTIQLISDELIRLVEQFGARNVILDFEEVEKLSSYMLSKLVELHKKIQARKGQLALCSMDREVNHVFVLTGLTKIFKIYPDRKSAVETF